MEVTTVQTALSVTIVLRGIDPPVERTVTMPAHSTLADLHRTIQIAFDGEVRAHHVFSDQEPFPHGFPPSPQSEYDDCAWTTRQDHYGWRPRRRWGDSWTMIDWRDPNVLSESDTPLTDAFAAGGRLHYRSGDPHAPGDFAWFALDAHGAVEPSSSVKITDGRGASPLSLLAVAEYAQLLRAYADPSHPDHEAAVARLARAAGPWAQFDPTGFEQGWVQQRLDRARPNSRGRTRSRLDAVLEALPASNAAGLERHLVSVGLNVPPLVTRDEMIRFVRPFAWLLDRGREGLPLDGAHLPAGLAQEWADACGTTVAQLPVVQRTARELRFVRTLQGRLLTMKSAVPLADDPLALWDALADKLPEAGDGRLRFVNALVLLAIADGSIADGGEDGGLDRIARAHDVRNDIDEDAWRARSWWEDRDFFLPADPSVSVASRVEVDSIRPLVLPLTERLEPLGLAARTRDTWRASRALQGFAQAALTTPAAISLSGGYGF